MSINHIQRYMSLAERRDIAIKKCPVVGKVAIAIFKQFEKLLKELPMHTKVADKFLDLVEAVVEDIELAAAMPYKEEEIT